MDTNTDHQNPDTTGQRPAAEVLADAVRVLTEAARLRRPAMDRNDDGQWQPHPTRTEPANRAEFVTLALAGAAANIGSVDAILAGRPGSWEADAVRNLLYSTVGYEEQYLFEHRTEPLRVVVDVEQILADLDIAWLYDDAEMALDQMEDDATARIDYSPYYWTYTRADDGQYLADDPHAPPWSIEAWRAALAAAEQLDGDTLHELERTLISRAPLHVSIVKSPEAAHAAAALGKQEDAILDDFRGRIDALAAQRAREWATYAEAFAANVRQEAARRYPGTHVEVEVNMTGPMASTADDLDFYGLPEAHLIEFATRQTPLPGSGLPPDDYPAGTSIHDAETAAGRLPHLRLPNTAEQENGR